MEGKNAPSFTIQAHPPPTSSIAALPSHSLATFLTVPAKGPTAKTTETRRVLYQIYYKVQGSVRLFFLFTSSTEEFVPAAFFLGVDLQGSSQSWRGGGYEGSSCRRRTLYPNPVPRQRGLSSAPCCLAPCLCLCRCSGVPPSAAAFSSPRGGPAPPAAASSAAPTVNDRGAR